MRSFLLLVAVLTVVGFLLRDKTGEALMWVSNTAGFYSETLANDHYGLKWFSVAIVLSALTKTAAKLLPSVIKHVK